MIFSLKGILEKKNPALVVIEVNGISYEISISESTYKRLPEVGKEVKLFISETVGLYGGITTLYGFLTQEEKDIFNCFKEALKNVGSKKALEYLDKASKSLPDFHFAVQKKDLKLLTNIFGFRRATAEKIVASLSEKIAQVSIPPTGEKYPAIEEISVLIDAISALVALGYKESQAKQAVEDAMKSAEKGITTEELIKLSLKRL